MRSYRTRFRMLLLLTVFSSHSIWASSTQSREMRRVAGVVVTPKNESLRAVIVIARTATGDWRTVTNDDGEFRLEAPNEDLALRVEDPMSFRRRSWYPVARQPRIFGSRLMSGFLEFIRA